MIVFVFKLESPKYYVIKTQFENASIAINKISGTSFSDLNATESIEYQHNVREYDWNFNGRSFSSLKKPKYRRAFIVGLMISIFHQLTGIDLIVIYISKISPFGGDDDILTFALVIVESALKPNIEKFIKILFIS